MEKNNPTPSNPGQEKPLEFDEVKDFVLDLIKKAGHRLPAEKIRRKMRKYSSKFDQVLDKLAAKGYLTKYDMENGGISYGIGENDKESNLLQPIILPEHFRKLVNLPDSGITVENYPAHREAIIEKAGKSLVGLSGHGITYLLINGMLLFLNFFVSGTAYPWFLYPLLGWGIGMFSHINYVIQCHRNKNELEKNPGLNWQQYRLLRQLQKKRSGFTYHLTACLAVMTLLFTVFLLHPTGIIWPLFPMVALMIGLFPHYISYRVSKSRILKKLKAAVKRVFPGQAPRCQENTGNTLLQRANILKEDILELLKGFDKAQHPFGEDIKPVLDNYIQQIKLLSEKKTDLENFFHTITTGDLGKELAVLKKKQQQTDSEYLQKEYGKSIIELEKQQKSITALNDQLEVLDLRLGSSLNSLNQMKIDLARMKGLSDITDKPSLAMIREKSRELSEYIEDLQKSYDELE